MMFKFSIDEDTAERLRVSFRFPKWMIAYGGGCWGAFAIILLTIFQFATPISTIIGVIFGVISICILGSHNRLNMGTLTIDNASKLIAMGIKGRRNTTFETIERIQISDYGSDQDLWIFPREGEMIVAARNLSTDQAVFLKEQIERRVGVQVIVEKVEGPRGSRIPGEVPLSPPPKV